MAEECVDMPTITEATMSRRDVGLRRLSSGKECCEHKIVPNYLRATTGSCHDCCKFGRKLALEAKERSSIPKRAERKPLHQVFGGLIMSVSENGASFDADLQNSEVSEVCVNKNRRNSFSTFKTRMQENSSSFKVDMDTTSKPTSKRVEPQLKSTFECVKTHPKSTSQLVRTLSKSASKKTQTLSKLSSFKENDVKLSGKHVASLSLDSGIVDSFEWAKTHPKSTPPVVGTLSKPASKKTQSLSRLSSFKDKDMKLSGKHVASLSLDSGIVDSWKPTIEWVKTYPKSNPQVVKTLSKSASKKTQTLSKLSSFKDKGMNLSGKHVTSLSLDSASPLRASLSSKSFDKKGLGDINKCKSLENVSLVVNQPKPTEIEPEEQNNYVEEKTLYVVEVETENQTLQSDQNANQEEDKVESENATSEFEEDSSSGKEYMENLEALEVEENGKPQENVDVSFEDKDCQKLTENLVETQIESSSPKKLEFKVDSDSIGAITGPEKIVLRHQELKGKKDEQLFNNVIEETASKLAEIQKSKVKALVNAFESIISLQENNTYAASIVI